LAIAKARQILEPFFAALEKLIRDSTSRTVEAVAFGLESQPLHGKAFVKKIEALMKQYVRSKTVLFQKTLRDCFHTLASFADYHCLVLDATPLVYVNLSLSLSLS